MDIFDFQFDDEEEGSDTCCHNNNKRALLQQPVQFCPLLHNHEWFLTATETSTPSLLVLKASWDRLFLLEQYKSILDEMQQYQTIILQDYQTPMFVKRELIQTWARSLSHLSSTKENCYEELLNRLNQLVDKLNVDLFWNKHNTIKSKASFQLFIWEQQARIFLNSGTCDVHDINTTLLKEAAHLIQKCIHCHVSLPALNSEYHVKREDASTNGGTQSFLDSLYMTRVRSYSLWKLLSQCYKQLGMTGAFTASDRHASSLTDVDYQEHKIYRSGTLNNSNIVTSIDAFEDSMWYIQFPDDGDENGSKHLFDVQFVNIYLNTSDSIHQVMHTQRNSHLS